VPRHRIRLMGPWEFAWDETSGEESPPATEGTTAMPCDWSSLFGPATGTVTFRRRFHRPSNLEAHERVWLVCTGVRGRGTVALNDERLSEFDCIGEATECDVTSHLAAFNVVSIRLSVDESAQPSTPSGLYEPVVLEIRSD